MIFQSLMGPKKSRFVTFLMVPFKDDFAQLQWPTHEKELYNIVCCFKMWQHYLRMHKTKVFTNISLKNFETKPRASRKYLKWHDTLALLDVQLVHKPGQGNGILDVLNWKEESQMEQPSTKTQSLRAIF
jgi:hypothetical protein